MNPPSPGQLVWGLVNSHAVARCMHVETPSPYSTVEASVV